MTDKELPEKDEEKSVTVIRDGIAFKVVSSVECVEDRGEYLKAIDEARNARAAAEMVKE